MANDCGVVNSCEFGMALCGGEATVRCTLWMSHQCSMCERVLCFPAPVYVALKSWLIGARGQEIRLIF